MFFEVSCQATAHPPILITGIVQISRGLLLRHAEKIHLIQRGNQARDIAAENAVEIDGPISVIS